MEITIIELGCPGHFIAADSCRWRRHTQVGKYRISTIGNYYNSKEERQKLGADKDSFFESMVFETTNEQQKESENCGCFEIKDWCELDSIRYKTAGNAQAGHEKLINKYLQIQTRDKK